MNLKMGPSNQLHNVGYSVSIQFMFILPLTKASRVQLDGHRPVQLCCKVVTATSEIVPFDYI